MAASLCVDEARLTLSVASHGHNSVWSSFTHVESTITFLHGKPFGALVSAYFLRIMDRFRSIECYVRALRGFVLRSFALFSLWGK
jgi:hypothetical protein